MAIVKNTKKAAPAKKVAAKAAPVKKAAKKRLGVTFFCN